MPGAHESHNVVLNWAMAFLCLSGMEQDWFQMGWGRGQYGSGCQVPLPARSCGFSWGAGQDGASSAPVSSPSGQGFVSWRGCESRPEDVSSSPVPLKDEGDLLRKERKPFGEFLHHQANNGGLLVKPALAWRESCLFPGNDETLWRSRQASILLSIKRKKFCD